MSTKMLRTPRRAKHRKPDVKKRVKPVERQTIQKTDFVAKKSIASLARLSPVHSEVPPLHKTVHWDMVVDHIGRNAPRKREGIINWLAAMLQPDVMKLGCESIKHVEVTSTFFLSPINHTVDTVRVLSR
jgi:hypothetical protein